MLDLDQGSSVQSYNPARFSVLQGGTAAFTWDPGFLWESRCPTGRTENPAGFWAL